MKVHKNYLDLCPSARCAACGHGEDPLSHPLASLCADCQRMDSREPAPHIGGIHCECAGCIESDAFDGMAMVRGEIR